MSDFQKAVDAARNRMLRGEKGFIPLADADPLWTEKDIPRKEPGNSRQLREKNKQRPKPDYEGPAGKPAPGDPEPWESPGRDSDFIHNNDALTVEENLELRLAKKELQLAGSTHNALPSVVNQARETVGRLERKAEDDADLIPVGDGVMERVRGIIEKVKASVSLGRRFVHGEIPMLEELRALIQQENPEASPEEVESAVQEFTGA
jgi:hypothetical protein